MTDTLIDRMADSLAGVEERPVSTPRAASPSPFRATAIPPAPWQRLPVRSAAHLPKRSGNCDIMHPSPSTGQEKNMAIREFKDRSGVLWRVWETRPRAGASVRPRYAQGWLGFETESERRRLAPIPEVWESATDDELWEFLTHAEEITTPVIGAAESSSGPREDEAHGSGSVLSRVQAVLRAVDRTLRG
jgi:hypothetical protein